MRVTHTGWWKREPVLENETRMTSPFPTASAYVMLYEGTTLRPFLLGESADDFGGDVKEEYGCDEGE
jgi:hypothetical protein